MRSRWSHRGVLLIVAGGLLCLTHVTQSQQTTAVTGRIVAPDGETPVPMAIVVLDDPASPELTDVDLMTIGAGRGQDNGPPFYGVQDETGELRVPSITPGTWRVSVFCGRERVPLAEPVQLTVTEGQTARLDITLPATNARKGRLVEAGTGKPVAGMMVGLVRPLMAQEQLRQLREPPQDFRVCVTGDDGVFWLFGDVAGDWSAFAGIAATNEPLVIGTVTVAPDPAVELVLTLPQLPVTQGLVVDAAGQPVPDTDVEINLVMGEGYSAHSIRVHTGPDGTYSVRQLPEGRFEVFAVCDKGWAALGQRELVGDAPDWRIELRPGGTVELTTRKPDGEPIGGQHVRFSCTGELTAFNRYQELTSDDQGKVSVANLAPGTYDVTGDQGPGIRLLIGPRDRLEADLLIAGPPPSDSPPPAADAPRPNSAAGDALGLRGTVRDADGRPVAGANVWLDILAPEGMGKPVGPAPTSDAGEFQCSDVKDGYHVATVSLGGRPVACVPFYAARGEQRTPLVVSVPRADASVRGRIVDAVKGEPVQGATVALLDVNQLPASGMSIGHTFVVDPATGHLSSRRYPAVFDLQELIPVVRSGDDGAFAFDGIAPGRYLVRVVRQDGVSRADTAAAPVVAGETIALGALGVAAVPVAPGQTEVLGTLRVATPGGMRLPGRLVGPDGNGVSAQNAEIALLAYGASVSYGPTRREADGTFELSLNPSGWYGLRVDRPGAGLVSFMGAVVRSDGQPSPIEIPLEPPQEGTAGVRVRVVQASGEPLAGPGWVVPVKERSRGGSQYRPVLSALSTLGPDDTCAIAALPPGQYRFLCRSDVAGRADTTTFYGYTDAVALRPGEEREVVIASEQLAEITGMVKGPNGVPVVGTVVSVQPAWRQGRIPDGLALVVTDAEGRFAVPGVEAGSWTATAAQVSANVIAVPGGTASAEISLAGAGGAPAPGVGAVMEAPGAGDGDAAAAAGVVVGTDGSPIPNAAVCLTQGGMPWPPRRVLTDVRGRFTLPRGQNWGGESVVAWAPGLAETRVEIAFPDQAWRLQQEGVAAAGEVTATLYRGSFVAGHVDVPPDDPAAGDLAVIARRKITSNTYVDEEEPRAAVATDGGFRIGPLAPGDWILNVIWGRLPRSGPAEVSLADGADVADVALTAPPLSSTFVGIVTDVDGVTPIADARITLGYGGLMLPVYELRTDADGAFEVHNIPPGAYSVTANVTDQVRVDLPEVTVEPGLCEILLARATAHRVVGRVVARAGQTAIGLRAVLTYEGQAQLDYSISASPVGADGTFVLEAPNQGKFTVYVLYGRSTMLSQHTVELPEQGDVRVPDTPV